MRATEAETLNFGVAAKLIEPEYWGRIPEGIAKVKDEPLFEPTAPIETMNDRFGLTCFAYVKLNRSCVKLFSKPTLLRAADLAVKFVPVIVSKA